MGSIYNHAETRRRLVASSSGNSPGDTITLQLNKDAIIKEHRIIFSLTTSTFTVAPTTATYLPKEIGRLITNLRLNVAGQQAGELYQGGGLLLVPFSNVYEGMVAKDPVDVTLGTTTTAKWALEIHYENDESKRELLTALNGNASSQVTLEITFSDSLAAVFGGTYTAGTARYSVDVISEDMAYNTIFDAAGNALSGFEGATSMRHFARQFGPLTNSAAGQPQQDLDVGNITRTILVYASDSSDVASDDVISQFSLVVSGIQRRVVTWDDMRMTAQDYGLDATGFGMLTWNEDEKQWLDLTNERQARAYFTTTAANNIRILQDYSR